MNNTCLS